jgi:hypothetical protein
MPGSSGSSSVMAAVKGNGSEAGSDAGSEGASTASGKSHGPDLSAMLPTYEHLPAGKSPVLTPVGWLGLACNCLDALAACCVRLNH